MAGETGTSVAGDVRVGVEISPARPARACGVDQRVSFNYSVAKVVSIFTVLAGHWFPPSIFWIPVTFALFVFAFSSAYFTARIYSVNLDARRFWQKKLDRLALRYWVILVFISAVVAWRGGTVLHWHTLMHFFGLSGVLNWFAIHNESGLGAGLWFFTLLLGFYLAYPYLARASRSNRQALAVALVSTVAVLYLREQVRVGHELWLTALGFILGVVYGAHEPRVRAWQAAGCAALGCIVLLVANVAGIKFMNSGLIAMTSVSVVVWLSKAEIPASAALIQVAKLESYLLEIFLIHTYLFVHPTGNNLLDLAITVSLIVVAAVAVNRIANWLASLVFERQHRPRD